MATTVRKQRAQASSAQAGIPHRQWERISAKATLVACIISAVALVIGGYFSYQSLAVSQKAYDTAERTFEAERRFKEISLRPVLFLYNDEAVLSIKLRNLGLGPAAINGYTIRYKNLCLDQDQISPNVEQTAFYTAIVDEFRNSLMRGGVAEIAGAPAGYATIKKDDVIPAQQEVSMLRLPIFLDRVSPENLEALIKAWRVLNDNLIVSIEYKSLLSSEVIYFNKLDGSRCSSAK